MRTNYILIDYENVQPTALDLLKDHSFKVIVFVGANQTKISFELAAALQLMGENAEYVKIDGTGANALDFHIAFHIGRLSEKEPNAYFHIISRDTGFDPLLKHLKSRKIAAARSQSISEIPLVRLSNSKTIEEKVSAIVNNLKERGNSRPRTLTTLSNTVNSLFMKQLDEQELNQIIKELQRRQLISVSENKVSYQLSK